MPRITSISSVNAREIFSRRISAIRASFPGYEKKLAQFDAALTNAEFVGHSGMIDKQDVFNIKRMATISLRMLRDVREAIRKNPSLKLYGSDLRIFVSVNMRARALLDRLNRLPEALDAFTEDADQFDSIDALAGPSPWDPDHNYKLRKKIDE